MTTVAAVVTDLMDRSRIEASLSEPVAFARDVSELTGRHADVVLVDLRLVPDPHELRRLAPSARIVAFGSHVDDEALEAARRAGIDDVLPRSAFFRSLSGLLA